MKSKSLWVMIGLLSLVLVFVLACGSSPTPTTTPKPTATTATPKPTASPTSTAKPTVSPTASPKPTATAAGVSFAGKTITLIVPFAPGGGTDISARLFATQLPGVLPGNPSVIVRNIPGGDANIGSNYAYGAKPDGLTLLFTSASVHLNQLLGKKASTYDLTKMIATIGQSNSNIYVARGGVVSKAEDLAKQLPKGIIFGHTAGGAAPIGFAIARELIGFPSVDKIIMGYPGAGDALRALLSGELNVSAVSGPMYNTSVMPLLKTGELLLVFQNGIHDDKGALIRDPVFDPKVPTALELYEMINGKAPPAGIALDAYSAVIAGGASLGKALMLPPGTPDNIVKTYWTATDFLLKDPKFLKTADEVMGAATWYRGESATNAFKEKFAIKTEVRQWLGELLKKYGVVVD